MLVLAMKFSRCDAHHRPRRPAASRGARQGAPTLTGRSAWLLPQNGTEGTAPSTRPTRRTNPTTSGLSEGANNQ
jgi:hypothetical protein